MLSSRGGRGRGEAEMPCASPPPPAPIFIRVSAHPTCIINVAQIVRGQVGIRGAIALESNAGFRQKCCVAVCELARSFARYKLRPGFAPVHRPAHGLRRGSNRARPYRSCVCAPVYMRLYDSCHVQGFRSLLPAITVARRARIIALIVSTRELDTRVTRAVKDNFGGGPYLGIKWLAWMLPWLRELHREVYIGWSAIEIVPRQLKVRYFDLEIYRGIQGSSRFVRDKNEYLGER